MLVESHDEEQIIARVAALDIGVKGHEGVPVGGQLVSLCADS